MVFALMGSIIMIGSHSHHMKTNQTNNKLQLTLRTIAKFDLLLQN